jgi:DNA-binding SARP family transcriptional activator
VLLASDDVNERLFLVGDKELLIYSVRQNSIRAVKYLDKKIRVNNNFSSVYNSLDGKIYCFTLNGALVYCLDISTGVWTESDVSSGSAEFFRHFNYYFSPADNSIYTFGGYGQHTYHNDIKRLDLSKNEWQDLTIRNGVFNPRYLAGLGSLNDTVYILGGYGSATGSQMVNPRSYFDLLGYSVKNRSLFRKFEIASIYDDMCVGSTFWVYRNNRDYYALIFEKNKYESALQLIRGSIDSSGVEIVGDKIPYKFFDIRSNASMFFFPGQNKLFACTSFVTDSMKTLLSIYSINFPPAQSSQVTMSSEGGKKGLYVIFAVVLVISAAAASLYFIGRRKGKRISSNEINTAEVPAGKVPENPAIKEPAVTPKYQLVLFGGFQVFSSSYEDITSKFTPLLKELFLLILLYSSRNNKGITSDQISEFLWFGKSESSARNNRAVNIAKLKTILSEMGSVELTKKTGYWKIYFDKENVKSDYSDFLEISGSKSNLNKFKILKLLEITRQGGFLVNLNYEWLDDIKSAVSDKIIETLIAFAEKCNMETDAEFIIHMADSIFNFDKVNEEAMVLKCKAECFLGNHSLAKTTYEKFVREYQKLYDEEFKKSFNEVVKS